MNTPLRHAKVLSISSEKVPYSYFNGEALRVVLVIYDSATGALVENASVLVRTTTSVGKLHAQIAAELAHHEITAIANLANALNAFNTGE